MKNSYIFSEGKGIASERLTILNECLNPLSRNIFKKMDLAGKHVLEVGCGIGIFTCELGKMVGKNGKVIATDISSKQLEVARKYALKNNISNIKFIQCSAENLHEINLKFDFIYTRYLLIHTKNPEVVLRNEIDRLKTGGCLVCTELISGDDGIYSYPDSDVVSKLGKYYKAIHRIHGTNIRIGMKLPSIFKKLGLSTIFSQISGPVLTTPREKKLLRLSIIELYDSLISNNLATQKELDSLIKDLERLENGDYVLCYGANVDICAKKI